MNTDRMRRDFTLSWTLDAPRAQVFRAWTDPDHLGWYYNDHQPIPNEPIEVDLRVGGVWRQRMVIDESTNFVTGGIYREIVEDERLVFTWGATDGWPKIDPERLDDGPLVTVTLRQVSGKTEMTEYTSSCLRASPKPRCTSGSRWGSRTAGGTPWIGWPPHLRAHLSRCNSCRPQLRRLLSCSRGSRNGRDVTTRRSRSGRHPAPSVGLGRRPGGRSRSHRPRARGVDDSRD